MKLKLPVKPAIEVEDKMASKKKSKKKISIKLSSGKTGKKKAKKEKVIREVPRRGVMKADLTDKAKKLIEAVDQIRAGKEAENEILGKLIDALGGSTYEHPKTGQMYTIMKRGDTHFHRVAPGHTE